MSVFLLGLKPKVAIIGLGRIGSSLAIALKSKGNFIIASTLHPEKHRDVAASGVEIRRNEEAADEADVIVLAVKPHQVRGVIEEIREVSKGKLVISVAAAITTKFLEEILPEARVVRAMPNLAAKVNESVTAISPGRSALPSDVEIAAEIFSSIGDYVIVDESMMDAITAIIGSGPAYAFIFIDALADAAVKAGLPKQLAKELIAKTLLGASKLLLESGRHPMELRDEVLTPGGVTISAVQVLERYKFRAAIMDAIESAVRRAEEIRKALSGE